MSFLEIWGCVLAVAAIVFFCVWSLTQVYLRLYPAPDALDEAQLEEDIRAFLASRELD